MRLSLTKISWQYSIFQLAFWGSYWLMNMVFAKAWGYNYEFMGAVFLYLSLIMFGVTHAIRWIYKRTLYKKSISVICLYLGLFLPIVSILVQLILYGLILLAVQTNPAVAGGVGVSSLGAFIGYSMNTCIIFIIWCLIYLLRAEWIKRRETEREYWQNQIKLRDMELHFLRSQINSHFLFNAINNIRSLILEDAQAARQGLSDLATLLRGLMQIESRQTVSLREEIEWVKGYLSLEALQFEQRLVYEFSVSPELLDAQLPPLLLQTLVENAIKHGIARRRMGGKIQIIASRLNADRWQLQVENPVAELAAEHKGNNIGLKNTHDRLQNVFGEKASFALDYLANKVLAKVDMPL